MDDTTISVSEGYSRLGLNEGATIEEVKATYKKLALRKHPDKNPNDPNATVEFQKIGEAYQRVVEHLERPTRTSFGHGGAGDGPGFFAFFPGGFSFFPFMPFDTFDEDDFDDYYDSDSEDEDDEYGYPFEHIFGSGRGRGGPSPFAQNQRRETEEMRLERERRERQRRQEEAQRRKREEELRKERERAEREEESKRAQERQKEKKAAKKARRAAAQTEAAEQALAMLQARQKKRTAAFWAARKGNRAAVKKAVWEDGVDHSGGEVLKGMEAEMAKKVKDEGETLLHLAVEAGDKELAEWLIDQGAIPEERDSAGFTPFHRALRRGLLPIIDYFLATFNPYDSASTAVLRTPKQTTSLQLAVSSGNHLAVFKVLDNDLAGVKEIWQSWKWIDEQVEKGGNAQKWEQIRKVLTAREGFTPPTVAKPAEKETEPAVPTAAKRTPTPVMERLPTEKPPLKAAAPPPFIPVPAPTVTAPLSPPATAGNSPQHKPAGTSLPPPTARAAAASQGSAARKAEQYPTPPATAYGGQKAKTEPAPAPAPVGPPADPNSNRTKKKAAKKARAEALAQALAQAEAAVPEPVPAPSQKTQTAVAANVTAPTAGVTKEAVVDPIASAVGLAESAASTPMHPSPAFVETILEERTYASAPAEPLLEEAEVTPPLPAHLNLSAPQAEFLSSLASTGALDTQSAEPNPYVPETDLKHNEDASYHPSFVDEGQYDSTMSQSQADWSAQQSAPPVANPPQAHGPIYQHIPFQATSLYSNFPFKPQVDIPASPSYAQDFSQSSIPFSQASSSLASTQISSPLAETPSSSSPLPADNVLPRLDGSSSPQSSESAQTPAEAAPVPAPPIFKVNLPKARLQPQTPERDVSPEPFDVQPQVRLPPASSRPAPPQEQTYPQQRYYRPFQSQGYHQGEHQPNSEYRGRGRGRGRGWGYGRGRGYTRGRGGQAGGESQVTS